MTEETDGVAEAFDGQWQIALTAAGRVGEQAARAFEQSARTAAAASTQEARELQNRLDAQRSAARAQLAPTERAEWWGTATPGDVAQAWETARSWAGLDPDARRAADEIRTQVLARYGVDVHAIGADPAALGAASAAREEAERAASRPRDGSRSDDVEAVLLMQDADWADQAREAPPEPGEGSTEGSTERYDSPERRLALAASLAGVADAETVQARLLADTNQATPASQAVATAPGATPAPPRQRGPARSKLMQKELD